MHPPGDSSAHALILSTLLGLGGCGASERDAPRQPGEPLPDAGPSPHVPDVPLPWAYVPFPEVPIPADNAMTEEKIELGRRLFYDPVVSRDGETACATCHSEFWGMGDGMAVSIGVGGGLLSGPGRQPAAMGRRNSPTLWNVAYRGTSFWDGRARSLEDQVHFPFAAEAELDRPYPEVVAAVAAIPEYQERFDAAFPDHSPSVSEVTFAQAIASFERTFVASGGLFGAYLDDDPEALSDTLVDGMFLFHELGCSSCHVPPLFSSEIYADRGVPGRPGEADAGRLEATGNEADRDRFKVPTLWNLRNTEPYFHTGLTPSLEEAVTHEVARSVADGTARELTVDEMNALVSFLKKGLVDSTRAPNRPEEVPSGLPVPIDGFDILR